MPDGSLTIRQAQSATEWRETAIAWAAGLKWEMGDGDAALFFSDSDSVVNLIAQVSGSPVGCVSLLVYSDGTAFLGLFIVLEEYRRRGIGEALFAEAIAFATNHRKGVTTIGLDAVEEQIPRYAKAGFNEVRWNDTYKGVVGQEVVEKLKAEMKREEKHGNVVVMPSSTTDLHVQGVMALEKRVAGFSRSHNFYTALMNMDGGFSFVSIGHEKNEEGQVNGWIVARPTAGLPHSFMIGPFYAETQMIAIHLLFNVMTTLPEKSEFTLEAPREGNEAIHASLLNLLGCTKIFQCCRMWTNGNVAGEDLQRLYSHLSLAMS